MSDTCILCQSNSLESADEKSRRVCEPCAKTTGLAPLPKSRRPPLPCQRCAHTQLVRVVPRELTAGGSDYVHPLAAPMVLTYEVNLRERLLFGGSDVHAPDATRGYGVLEAYVCRACGFVEWYAQRPEDLPIGPAFNSELVDVEANATPYRR